MSPQPKSKQRPTRKAGDRELLPWIKPGSTVGYASELKKARKWPSSDGRGKRRPKRGGRECPVATAYLFVPFDESDSGVRPTVDARVQHSTGVRILDASGASIERPQAGDIYMIEATVRNRGVAPAYFGLADFYVAGASDTDAAAAGAPPPPAIGRTGFILNPASSGVVACPQPWSPQTAEEADASIVVQVYDPTSDMLTSPFDAHTDRHVGRRDAVADFAGVWDGTISTSWGTGPFLQRLIVTQVGATISMGYYGQLGGGLPGSPQWIGAGVLNGEQASGFTIEYLGGRQFTTNAWTLTLTSPNTLAFYNHCEFVAPGDPRGTQIDTGILTR